MNICEVIKLAREKDCAFRQNDWAEGISAYHGIDNLIVIKNAQLDDSTDFVPILSLENGSVKLTVSASLFLSENWELVESVSYHGNLK